MERLEAYAIGELSSQIFINPTNIANAITLKVVKQLGDPYTTLKNDISKEETSEKEKTITLKNPIWH